MVDIIIKSKIKEALPKELKDLRISVELAEALNKKVEENLKKAAERAKANHRTTILPQDI
jgi:histone H3/H4